MANYKPQIYVDFYNINTDEEVYMRRPAQIKAAIESSDMGVNKQSDRGWRLGKVWKKKVEAARNDRAMIRELTKVVGGADKITDTDILVAVYEREVEADIVMNSGNTTNAKYEQKYRQMLEEEVNDEATPPTQAKKSSQKK